MHIATNAGHTTQNDGQTMQNDGRPLDPCGTPPPPQVMKITFFGSMEFSIFSKNPPTPLALYEKNNMV